MPTKKTFPTISFNPKISLDPKVRYTTQSAKYAYAHVLRPLTDADIERYERLRKGLTAKPKYKTKSNIKRVNAILHELSLL